MIETYPNFITNSESKIPDQFSMDREFSSLLNFQKEYFFIFMLLMSFFCVISQKFNKNSIPSHKTFCELKNLVWKTVHKCRKK